MMSDFDQKQGFLPSDLSAMDNQFERFELLSAYIDGEVTAQERKQVQQWLDTDPQFHQLYKELLRLQREIPAVEIPENSVTPDQLSDQVFDSIDRQQRSRRGMLVGGLAIAAVMVGTVSNLWLRDPVSFPRYAERQTPAKMETEALTIALNRPLFEIPP
ncbi:MAG: anti-sigma factor, partial [Cyanobacteria bacterium P01_G01_bin.49]